MNYRVFTNDNFYFYFIFFCMVALRVLGFYFFF